MLDAKPRGELNFLVVIWIAAVLALVTDSRCMDVEMNAVLAAATAAAAASETPWYEGMVSSGGMLAVQVASLARNEGNVTVGLGHTPRVSEGEATLAGIREGCSTMTCDRWR